MSDLPMSIPISKPSRERRQFQPPDLPEEEWCDFRIDFERGMSLKDIAEKYICDPRTVRKCILLNRSSHTIGKQYVPTRISQFTERIEGLYEQLQTTENSGSSPPGICRISLQITEILKSEGYQGSERTIRNFLRQKYPITIKKRQNHLQEAERRIQ